MSDINHRRRLLLAGLGAVPLLAACTPNSAVVQIIDSYRTLDKAKANYPVTRATIDAQPHPVLGAQMEGGSKGLLVFDRSEGELDYWRSGNGVIVVLQGARLIRSTGFPQDQLGSVLVSGIDPLSSGQPLDRSARYEYGRDIDLAPATYALHTDCTLRFNTTRTIDLLGVRHVVDEWEERLRFPSIRKQWKQLWQVDAATGTVWRSIQHVGIEDRLIAEVLKAKA